MCCGHDYEIDKQYPQTVFDGMQTTGRMVRAVVSMRLELDWAIAGGQMPHTHTQIRHECDKHRKHCSGFGDFEVILIFCARIDMLACVCLSAR